MGPDQNPQYIVPISWRDCGLLTNSTTHNNELKKTHLDNNRERSGGHHVVFSRKISRMDQKKTMHFVRLQKLVVILRDEHVLENLYDRFVNKSALMKHAMT